MSRHGSGKRRRTSPDPDDTGPGGSGEHAAHGAEPYAPTAYEPPTPDPGQYDPGQYDSGTYEAAPYEAPRYDAPPYDPAHDSGQYGSGQYEAAPYGSDTYDSGTYDAQHPQEAESYEAAAYGASAYDPARDAPGVGHTAEFAALPGDTDEPATPEPAESGPTATRDRVADPEPATGMRPAPPPLEGDIVKLVAVGSLIWFALFVAAWFMRDSLAEDDHGWWPWCALAGSGLGLFGLWYCRRLRDAQED